MLAKVNKAKYETKSAYFSWYWCYYPYTSRDSVSPVCWIFINDPCRKYLKSKKPPPWHFNPKSRYWHRERKFLLSCQIKFPFHIETSGRELTTSKKPWKDNKSCIWKHIYILYKTIQLNNSFKFIIHFGEKEVPKINYPKRPQLFHRVNFFLQFFINVPGKCMVSPEYFIPIRTLPFLRELGYILHIWIGWNMMN